jgi:hypothetical protein
MLFSLLQGTRGMGKRRAKERITGMTAVRHDEMALHCHPERLLAGQMDTGEARMIGTRVRGVCGSGKVLSDPDSSARHAVRGRLWLPATPAFPLLTPIGRRYLLSLP